MPSYIKTKVIEDELSKIEQVEQKLNTLIEEVSRLSKDIQTLRENIQKRTAEAFRLLKSE